MAEPTYEKSRVTPLTAALGAEVSGVDLGKPLDEATRDEIYTAWLSHQVLFFRDQDISLQEHKNFALAFGDIFTHPVYQPLKDQGHPEVLVLSSGGDKPGGVAATWHSDVTFEPEPPMASILRAVEVPEAGGDTMWASMYAAYEALSDTMQRLLGQLRAIHAPGYFYEIATPEQRRRFDERPPTTHPIIRTHPATKRKGIFVNQTFTRGIEGMNAGEGQALLNFLYRHIETPDFHCRFHWTPNAIAMWDNRCTQHRVCADNPNARRHMQRLTLLGDAPF